MKKIRPPRPNRAMFPTTSNHTDAQLKSGLEHAIRTSAYWNQMASVYKKELRKRQLKSKV